MDELKEQLSTKGAHCNLQFTTAEKEYFERECGFTDEELEIFRFRARGIVYYRYHLRWKSYMARRRQVERTV